MSGKKLIEVRIDMKDGFEVDAKFRDGIVVDYIGPWSVLAGKLRLGDQIAQVNNKPLKDVDDFNNSLSLSTGFKAVLLVIRDEKQSQELEASAKFWENRTRLIPRYNGFSMRASILNWVPGGPKLGISVKQRMDHVVVFSVEPGSLASDSLFVGDMICDVGGVPVTTTDEVFVEIVKAKKEQGKVEFVVQRPESDDAKKWVKCALSGEPSVAEDYEVGIEDRIKKVPKKEGFLYGLVDVVWRDKNSTGMGIELFDFENKVIVANVAPGAQADGFLLAGDIIYYVEEERVADKETVLKLLSASTASRWESVQVIVGRPNSVETKRKSEDLLKKFLAKKKSTIQEGVSMNRVGGSNGKPGKRTLECQSGNQAKRGRAEENGKK